MMREKVTIKYNDLVHLFNKNIMNDDYEMALRILDLLRSIVKSEMEKKDESQSNSRTH